MHARGDTGTPATAIRKALGTITAGKMTDRLVVVVEGVEEVLLVEASSRASRADHFSR